MGGIKLLEVQLGLDLFESGLLATLGAADQIELSLQKHAGHKGAKDREEIGDREQHNACVGQTEIQVNGRSGMWRIAPTFSANGRATSQQLDASPSLTS